MSLRPVERALWEKYTKSNIPPGYRRRPSPGELQLLIEHIGTLVHAGSQVDLKALRETEPRFMFEIDFLLSNPELVEYYLAFLKEIERMVR